MGEMQGICAAGPQGRCDQCPVVGQGVRAAQQGGKPDSEETGSPRNRTTVETRLGWGGAGQHPNFGLRFWVRAGESLAGEQPAPGAVTRHGVAACARWALPPWRHAGGGPELGQRTPRGGRDSLCLQRGSPRALCARPSAWRLGRPAPAPRPRSFLPGRPAGACDTAGRSGPGLLCKPQPLRGIPRSAPGSALPRSLQFLESSVAPGSQGSRGLGEGASSRRHTSSEWSWLWPGLGGVAPCPLG